MPDDGALTLTFCSFFLRAGEMWTTGTGVAARDEKLGFEWYLKSANQKLKEAQYAAGMFRLL
jgi:TPR repeat protein